MAHTLRVHRKAYHRKGYETSKGSYVHPSEIPATDFTENARKGSNRARGKPVHKVIPKLKKGVLKIHFSDPTKKRRKQERKDVKKYGKKRVVGRLHAIAVLEKNTNPKVANKAAQDAHYIAGSFDGKRPVPYPQGFRSSAKGKLRSIS